MEKPKEKANAKPLTRSCAEDVPWPPIHLAPLPLHAWLDDSVNIIAIKVAKSDVKYPIRIYGTVLARDEYDFRCIYLFRCGRDDPQRITFKDNTLTLISPIRAPAQPTTKELCSCLSTMELVYTPVPYALEASVAVSILKGPSDFTSKVTAWTTGNDENKIVLYDSKVAGSRTKLGPGGSVCGLVAVPLHQDLVLCVSVHDEGHERAESFEFVIEQEVDERTLEQGPYKLQAKISWKGVKNQRGNSTWGRPNMWGHIGGRRVLL
ncbi:unnamed protein product [Urochloa decumbens]|uniref:DUF6598 domain-containing protein n=1 Tax=Urochloa decumbens TaxID=240449 RepID=A0ABC9CFC6_9POAL